MFRKFARKSFLLFLLCLVIFYENNSFAKFREDVLSSVFSKKDIDIALQANSLVNEDKWDEAYVEALKAESAVIAKVFFWRSLLYGKNNISFQEAANFLQENKHFPKQNLLHIAVEKLLDENDAITVLEWFKERVLYGKYIIPRMPNSYAGMHKLAHACVRAKEYNLDVDCNVEELVSQVWINYDFDYSFSKEQKFIKQFKKEIFKHDTVKRINRLLWNNQITSAKRVMNMVDDDYKKLFDARISLKKNDGNLLSALVKVPRFLKLDEGLLYDRVVWNKKMGLDEEVLHILKNTTVNSDFSDKWWKQKQPILQKLIAAKDYSAAYDLVAAMGYFSKGRKEYIDNQWFAGWTALKHLQKPKKAYRHFYNIYKHSQNAVSISRGAYWAGRAAEESGDLKTAETWKRKAAEYFSTFYGQIAISELNYNYDKFPIYREEIASSLKPEMLELVKAIIILEQIDEKGLAEAFLKHFNKISSTQEKQSFLIFLRRMQSPKYLSTITKAMLRENNVVLSKHLFPVISDINTLEDIEFEIDLIDSSLVNSVIFVESLFDVEAISKKDAYGLMQIRPITAKHMCDLLKIDCNKRKLITDPQYNIIIGNRYLEYLIDYYDGSYLLAIAAYNAGLSNINKWIEKNGDPRTFSEVNKIVDWIESIPFSETRNYTQRVFEYLQLYRLVLQHDNMERILKNGQEKKIDLLKDIRG